MDMLLDELHSFFDSQPVSKLPAEYCLIAPPNQREFTKTLDTTLRACTPGSIVELEVLEHVHLWLSSASDSAIVWEWLTYRIRELCECDERLRWCIAIWAPWSHKPLSWRPLAHVFQWFHDEHTRWAVLMCYEDRPTRILQHFLAAQHRAEFTDLQIPDFEEASYRKWTESI